MLKIMRSRRMPALLTTMLSLPKVSTRALDDALGALEIGDALAVGHGFAAGRLDLVDHLLRRAVVGAPVPSKCAPRSLTTTLAPLLRHQQRFFAADAAAAHR